MVASQYFNQIQQLYIAYFGRPADPEGQSYWAAEAASDNGSLSSVIANFSVSAESNTLFQNLSAAQMVTAIYMNTFNREPEAEGLAYWIGQIQSGAISKAQAAWTIQQSAGTEDSKTVQHKLAAANAFTSQIDTAAEIAGYAGSTALAQGRAFLETIDGSTASMENLQANAVNAVTIATASAPTPGPGPVTPVQPQKFSATEQAGVVSFSGSATGEITVAWSGAVGNSDATFSRGGHDANPISFGSGTAVSVNLAANETLVGSASTLAGLTVNGTGTVNLEDTAVNLSGGTFAATSTTNDVLTVTFEGIPGGLTDLTKLTGFETIYLKDSSPFTNSFSIADGAGTTINAVGSVGVHLGTGGQVFNGSTDNDIVTGGTGNDTISAGLGFNLQSGGGGNDTFNIAAASTNMVNDLNTGDVLVVAANGSVTASGVSAFVATSATVNDGSVEIQTFMNSVINLSQAEGSNGFTVIGHTGNDTFTGSAKNDLLTGGTGNNTFVMTGVTAATNGSDTITDFTAGTDKIVISLMAVNTVANASLLEGALTIDNFITGPGAIADTGSSYFAYDTTTGTLSFDADGTGAGEAVALVILTGAPTLAASDIILGA